MYIENIKKPDYDNNENSYISNEIMNFIIKITKKYKTDINAKLVNQLDKEDDNHSGSAESVLSGRVRQHWPYGRKKNYMVGIKKIKNYRIFFFLTKNFFRNCPGHGRTGRIRTHFQIRSKKMNFIYLFFWKKLFILLFYVQEENINECQEENNNYIYENNDITEEVTDNHDLSEEELEQEDFTYFDENRYLSLIKNKFYELAKTYYKINGKENFYNDNTDKLPNKRKNDSKLIIILNLLRIY